MALTETQLRKTRESEQNTMLRRASFVTPAIVFQTAAAAASSSAFFPFSPSSSSSLSSVIAVVPLLASLPRHKGWVHDGRDAGVHDRAPRDGVDFEFTGHPSTVLPGSHPLPLNDENVEASRWPLVSPYLPSPGRTHPYWTEPPAELPFFPCSVPVVYSFRVMKERIVVPVFRTGSGGVDNESSVLAEETSPEGQTTASSSSSSGDSSEGGVAGSVSHTRELDPFVFGLYPDQDCLAKNSHYWMCRTQNYSAQNEIGQYEIFRKSKKNWANHGTGMGRVSDRKNHMQPWGGRKKPNKAWNYTMPSMPPNMWQLSNRMMLTLKMLQGKLMVVDRLSLEEPTKECFQQLCTRMGWDVRHDGAGVLFIDGGSRLAPSMEFDLGFFYGSFYNGRCKLVRPTLTVDKPYDWNYPVRYNSWRGPRGQKNPVPLNRFNCYDALDHHLLVVTEGAIMQMEQELEHVKIEQLPPHIAAQLPERGYIGSQVPRSIALASGANAVAGTPGATDARLLTMEQEVAGRVEENEIAMYSGYYDDPYRPWQDEEDVAASGGGASYEVDAVDGFIRRHTPASLLATAQKGGSLPASWRQLS